MATAADIGANFSDYTGNAGAAGGNFGAIVLDTKPLEQLSQYTYLYNREKWQQKQKETDAKVAQLADLSNISLNSLRGKDKEQVSKQFSELVSYASDFARKNPQTQQERIQDQLEWQTHYGAFMNNYNSGKGRALSYYAHLNTIQQNVTDASTQDEAIKQLDQKFDSTSIDTPISATPNFKTEQFNIPPPNPQKFNSVIIGGNDNIDVEGTVYNPKQNAGAADAAILGIKKAYPKKGTPEYDSLSANEKNQANIQATIESEGKGWVDAVEPLNEALKKYVKTDGSFDKTGFENENSSNTTLMNAYNALKNYDKYSRDHYNQAVTGVFDDKGVQVPLPPNVVADDFKAGFVDFSKGINPNQLVQSGMFAQYKGDVFNKKITHSGDQRAIDLEKMRELNALKIKNLDEGGANYRAGLDLIGKGYTRDAKGKWVAPVKTSATAVNNGGIIPYWQNYIAPQIDLKSLKITSEEGGFLGFGKKTKETAVPENYTGDVDVASDKISGLGVALTGVTDPASGHPIPYTKDTPTKIRFQNGKPIGIVIDGVFYDPNDINTKATSVQDKNVNNKFDSPVFGQTIQPESTTQSTSATAPAATTSKGLPIFK